MRRRTIYKRTIRRRAIYAYYICVLYMRTIYKCTIRRRTIYKCTIYKCTIRRRPIHAGILYISVLYAGVLYKCTIYAFMRFITSYTVSKKTLFKINALPKILEKTRLKSMLCLFLDAMPKMPFLVLGIGKSFKINNLRLIWGCCAHDSQNFKKGGGD